MYRKENVPMRRLVMSDSHGSYKGMMQCLDRSGFNQDTDLLIHMGDIVDGWGQSKESIELVLNMKHVVFLLGNHDQWAMQFYKGEMTDDLSSWLRHGGAATKASYGLETLMDAAHLELLMNAKPYYITEDNKLFVHAGFDPQQDLAQTDKHVLIWNREFARNCYMLHKESQNFKIEPFEEIYIGHTPTTNFDKSYTTPLQLGNVTLMDTGAAFQGRLSIMDIDTKQVWQSDKSKLLYPDQRGRNSISWDEEQKLLKM